MFPGSFRQETSRPVPTVAEADVAAPPPSGRGVSCASSEGHPNAIPVHATKHSNQERPNRQGVRNSIIGFVLSPKGPFEHPREPAQALSSNGTDQTSPRHARRYIEVFQNPQFRSVSFCTDPITPTRHAPERIRGALL